MSSSGKRTRQFILADAPEPTIDIVIYDDSASTHRDSSAKRRKRVPKPLEFRVDGPLPFDPVLTDNTPANTDAQSAEVHDPILLNQVDDNDLYGSMHEATQDTPEEEPASRSHRKNANDYLREWLLGACDSYVHASYAREAPPESSDCDSCLKPTGTLYRCTTCLGHWTYCAACLLSSHCTIPTHRVEVWNEVEWAKQSLADLGLVLNLGHCGRPCDEESSEEYAEIYLGDLSGFTPIVVRFCTHVGAPSISEQLLAAGIFPCTDSRPKSGFTTSLLDTLNIFTTLGRTSAHKFYLVLEHITKPGFPSDVKDRYREMMATHRRFVHVSNLKRSSHHFPPDLTDVLPGDQALECVACPRPGWNFEWDKVADCKRVWFRHFVSYDGNFRSVRKFKKVSAGDMCLSDGLAYFGLKEPYKKWTESEIHPQRQEKPACDNHKAGNDTGVRWAGQDITGIGAFTCTSHSCIVPWGVVDYFKGERFIYADYAFASAVKYLTRLGPLAFGMTYDVWCHWITNFFARAQNLPPNLALPKSLDLKGAIPKWHIPGHDILCFIRWALDHMQYVGRMEGEGVKRVWAHMNEHSGSTSEQGPGTRTDSLNNMAGQWNFEKMISMIRLLPAKFIEAKRMMLKQRAVHKDLASRFSSKFTKELENTSLEPVQGPDKKWTSPLFDPLLNHGFQSKIQAGRESESSTTRVPGKRPGATRWISDGVELEHSMRKTHYEAKRYHKNATPGQANELNKNRTKLYQRVVEYNKNSLLYLAGIDELDHPGCNSPEDDAPESMQLWMPSSWLPETLATAGLSSLSEQERKLRRGLCNDALESVKRLLCTRPETFTKKGKVKGEASGQIAITRAKAKGQAHSERISHARWRYDNLRDALMRLGPSEEDSNKYLELKDDDLKPLKSFLDDDSRGVGQGYKAILWIWRNHSIPDIDDWRINALRTEWFRSRERYKRWEEQLVLLKREMVMTIRSFRRRAEVWEMKGRLADAAKPGMRAYAMKCSRFYDKLGGRMFRACKGHLNDDVVTFQWSEDWLKDHGTLYVDLEKQIQIFEPYLPALCDRWSRTQAMLSHLRPIWEGHENEVFGEGGYDQFMTELLACTFGLEEPTADNEFEHITASEEDLAIVDERIGEPATPQGESRMVTPSEDGEPTITSSPTTSQTSSQTQASPVRRIRFPVRYNKRQFSGSEKKKKEPSTPSAGSATPVPSSHRSSESPIKSPNPPSPTYPLKPVTKKKSNSSGSPTASRKKKATNSVYVELPSPKQKGKNIREGLGGSLEQR